MIKKNASLFIAFLLLINYAQGMETSPYGVSADTWKRPEISGDELIFPLCAPGSTLDQKKFTVPATVIYMSSKLRGMRFDIYEDDPVTFARFVLVPDGLADQLLKDGINFYCHNDANASVESYHTRISMGSRMIALALVLGASLHADAEVAKNALRTATNVNNDCLAQLLMSKNVKISDVE